MKIANTLLTLLLIISTTAFGKENALKHINRVNESGKREGYWILDENNNPVVSHDPSKTSEGKYVNGRKEGVWIYYYEGGKSPRLVGEYSDNRPSGTYFRFNKKGEMFVASANRTSLRRSNRIASSNQIYSCELNFENQEIVAGQVFFTHRILRNNSYRFWMTRTFETTAMNSPTIDFSWLHNNYNAIYANYLEARKVATSLEKLSLSESKKPLIKSKPVRGAGSPPLVKNPIVAEGQKFDRNGWNKLFTKNSEIWMDGFFKDGQLQDGKVFAYDNDGVLLKVRVYKKGEYYSEGGL